jgi:hypothetical protein
MSRSIHRNRSRKHLVTLDWGFDDVMDILSKRDIKRMVRSERRRRREVAPEGASPDAIPVLRVGSDPRSFVPASVDDIREVLRRLPRGATAGLREIRVQLGRLYVREHAPDEGYDYVLDPFGRPSREIAPGVYVPWILGKYDPDQNIIWLFSYAREPESKLDAPRELACKGLMLNTLVHEVAHHQDWTTRVARGRWRMHREQKREDYAEMMMDEWWHNRVLPYLRDCHANSGKKPRLD